MSWLYSGVNNNNTKTMNIMLFWWLLLLYSISLIKCFYPYLRNCKCLLGNKSSKLFYPRFSKTLVPKGPLGIVLESYLLLSSYNLLLREKYPNTEFFLVRIFPHSDWIRRDTSYLSVFSPNADPYSVWMWENTDQKKFRILAHCTQWSF